MRAWIALAVGTACMPSGGLAQDGRSGLLLQPPANTAPLLCRRVARDDAIAERAALVLEFRYGTDTSIYDLGQGMSLNTRRITAAWDSTGRPILARASFTREVAIVARVGFEVRASADGALTGEWSDRDSNGRRAGVPLSDEEANRVEALMRWLWSRRCEGRTP